MNDTNLPIEAPLELWRDHVRDHWLDYNGHMNEAYYLLIFSHATDAFMDYIGLDDANRRETNNSIYTAETHITYLREVAAGESVRVATQLLAHDPKRAQVFHTMYHADDGQALATAEKMLLHIDMSGPRVAPFSAAVLARLQAIQQVHATLPTPPQAGASIGLQREHSPT